MPGELEESLQSLINRAVIYSDPGESLETAVVDLPVPQPADGEVLVRLSVFNIYSSLLRSLANWVRYYAGVCHTDVSFCLNALPGLRVPTPKGKFTVYLMSHELLIETNTIRTNWWS